MRARLARSAGRQGGTGEVRPGGGRGRGLTERRMTATLNRPAPVHASGEIPAPASIEAEREADRTAGQRYTLYIDETGDRGIVTFQPTYPVLGLCGCIIEDTA
jgi:hypothetical protein